MSDTTTAGRRTSGLPIRLEGVTKRYPGQDRPAVDAVSLEIPAGETVMFVGPSGCGKTTLLKMLNRLIEPTGGTIRLGDEDVTRQDPDRLRRCIGYVIQAGGLFPHMTVATNVGLVPKMLGWERNRVAERTEELLDLVGLDPATYRDRYPRELSGGQQQRVGVARALAADPPVLLMDEPFGAVDPVVREHLQNEFLKLQSTLHKTVLFVTHDIEEAVRLGDRIAVYGEGRIEQFDPPAKVLGAPATPYVADFVGADRGLKRLSVTPIERGDLEAPPVVHLDDPLDKARARMRADGARWAVVLDDADELHGWLSAEAAGATAGDGAEGATAQDKTAAPVTVADHARRMEAWLPLGAPLKQAFSSMLQHDAGWIAVLDEADRFVGVLTPSRLHEALRRSIDADERDVSRGEVELETVADA